MSLAPETEARLALAKIIEELWPAAKVFKGGRLHKSLGDDFAYASVYPDHWQHGHIALQAEMLFVIQYFGQYDKQIDRFFVADPTPVEEQIERLREKLKEGHEPRTPHVWFWNLERVAFPPDPMGGVTRFEATIKAFGENTTLLETK